MANLVISYDLYKQGQNYEAVQRTIKSLGTALKLELSYWFVSSNLTASQAADKVWAVMDANDKLVVVDASNNTAAWNNLDAATSNSLKSLWK